MLRYQFHGMGGRIGRPVPWCLPLRRAVTNISSVQLPRPVALSEVRFIAKLTPHGPTQAPRWLFTTVRYLSGAMRPAGTGANFSVEGFPESSRAMSGSGPLGPSFFGV